MKEQRAFTVIELLIVIVVIAILATVATVSYMGITDHTRQSALRSDLSQAAKVLETKRVSDSSDLYPADQAAAIAAGIKASANSTQTYSYNTTQNSYCLTETDSGGISYFITSALKKATPGSCTGLSAWWPLNGSAFDASGSGATGIINGLPQ